MFWVVRVKVERSCQQRGFRPSCCAWVVQTAPRGRLCQQRGAQICVLCCADESIGRFVSTEGFTCVVYRLKHREREREIVSKEGVQMYTCVVCFVQVKAERERLCQQRLFRHTPVWFVLCRLKRREIPCEQVYTCVVCVVLVKAERDTV